MDVLIVLVGTMHYIDVALNASVWLCWWVHMEPLVLWVSVRFLWLMTSI